MMQTKKGLDRIVQIMISLSAEHDVDILLENILRYAMEITHCDGGTVYTKEEEHLHFRNMITESLGKCASSKDGGIDLPSVPLGRRHVCACAALDKKVINLPNIYESEEYDFSGAREYDAINGYHTVSMLVIPMVDEKERVIGVLQLINAQAPDGSILPFKKEDEAMIFGLSSLVAVCLNNMRLSQAFSDLLHSFVQTMVQAIGLRTPYNANHTKSMVRYADRFIHWLNAQGLDWHFEEDAIDPFLMSVWLHDIGKLITPLSVMEKSTRLGGRISEIKHRFTVAILMEELRALREPALREDALAKKETLEKARDFIYSINEPGFLTDELAEEVQRLSELTCFDENGNEIPLITEDEREALSVRKGTLTDAERRIMDDHVSHTAQMLSNVNFTGEYAPVPLWAAAHHELLDGSGYPDGRSGDELPTEVRLLTILDIYDALTAGDRPYKAPLSPAKAFDILRSMASDGKLDPDILDLFYRSGAWEDE